MTTSMCTSTVTHGAAGAGDLDPTEYLSRRIIAAALAHRELGGAVQRRREITIPEQVLVRVVWQLGITTVTINDPDTAGQVAEALALTQHPTHSPDLHTWQGVVCDVPVVLVGRGRLASDLTPETAARIIADIVALDVTA
jgi:hypothetical protein